MNESYTRVHTHTLLVNITPTAVTLFVFLAFCIFHNKFYYSVVSKCSLVLFNHREQDGKRCPDSTGRNV